MSSARRNRRALLKRSNERGLAFFQNRDYAQAEAIFQQNYKDAGRLGENDMAGWFLTDLGSCYFARCSYRKALDTYVAARAVAQSTGEQQTAAAISANISSLHWEMKELDAAVEFAESSLSTLRGLRSPDEPKILILLANLRAEQGRVKDALELFRRGIALADQQVELTTVAQGWDRLGEAYLQIGQLAQAEHCILEAYRLRKLNRVPHLDLSYRYLGMLRAAQGDLPSAANLLDLAVASSKTETSLAPLIYHYQERGKVRLAQGRLEEAVRDFRTSVDFARRWRLDVLPADSSRLTTEGDLQQIYSSFIDSANRLYLRNGSKELLREAFETAEENRAGSLRALKLAGSKWQRSLPAEYWQALRQSQALELELIRSDRPDIRAQARWLRGRVAELEAISAPELRMETSDLLRTTQQALDDNTAFLSFHLDKSASCLWALTNKHFELYPVAPQAELSEAVHQFVDDVRSGSTQAAVSGAKLFQLLFGGLQSEVLSKPRWVLSLDEQLFQVPFSALVMNREGERTKYLAAGHSLQITSGASLWSSRGSGASELASAGAFLGIGDAIYNTADSRWPRPTLHLAATGLPVSDPEGAWKANGMWQNLYLARLAGSGREIELCARTWTAGSGKPILLKGADASKANILTALGMGPAVVHFATHLVQAEQAPRHALIALSLSPKGEPEFLSPLEIATWSVKAQLVVLSGCSSGVGEALPGTGLMGMTRAWIAAGARSVITSRWPTPDDSGALFAQFYQHFREQPQAGAAAAFQNAQLDMLRTGDWRSNPLYWAAFFVLEN